MIRRRLSSRAFYNEIDRYCCDWLSSLMDAGLITPGKIDDRPIQELSGTDLEKAAKFIAACVEAVNEQPHSKP